MIFSARRSSSRDVTPGAMVWPMASSTRWTIRLASSMSWISPGVFRTISAPNSVLNPERRVHPGGHFLDGQVPVDLAEQTALSIITDQRLGFFPIDPLTLPDHLFRVVAAPPEERPAHQLVLRN